MNANSTLFYLIFHKKRKFLSGADVENLVSKVEPASLDFGRTSNTFLWLHTQLRSGKSALDSKLLIWTQTLAS